MDPLDILIRYRKVRRHRDFDLRQFVENHFWMPETYSEYVSDPGLSLKEHIDSLWPVLTREPQDHIPWSSLLALPQAYIVPGGDSARPTTGIPTSPCWGWRRAAVTIC
jgi:alpha,alpha-trehalase